MLIIFLFLLNLISPCYSYSQNEDQQFLARITAIDEHDARKIGRRYGFEIDRKLLSFDDVYIGKQDIFFRLRKKRGIEMDVVEQLITNQKVEWIERLDTFRRFKRTDMKVSNPPTHVWNLKPSMNIEEAWKSGYNGTTVTIAVVDDGIDVEHIDLRSSFTPELSFDFVRFGNLPTPSKTKETQHGTQCAGLVTMEGNLCGLGVGHGAKLGGIRLLGPDMLNDALEGDALAFQRNKIDIYSVSWGPKDDGKMADKPKNFTEMAIREGATEGRNGKGNIFIWASGNGGRIGDNCALDGYVSNEFTLSFGVISSDGSPSDYAEGCSAVIAAVSGGDANIRTTGFDSTCSAISGSSASAAIAAGIIGLALQANPNLTRRDIQHIIVHSANPEKVQNVKWETNAAGHKFHQKVGFGLLDAQKMTKMAANWVMVGKEETCETVDVKEYNNPQTISLDFCQNINRIERVIITLDLLHSKRGMAQISLLSPSGTLSEILPFRPSDTSENLLNWTFVSTNFFDETAVGTWTLQFNSTIPFKVKNIRFKITGTL